MLLYKFLLFATCLAARASGAGHITQSPQVGLPRQFLRSPSPSSIGHMSLPAKRGDTSGFRYYGNDTSKFLVQSLPDFDFDLGELYAGSIPVDKSDSNRTSFFVFQPTIGKHVDELTVIYSCSSVDSFFRGPGRWTWSSGVFGPVVNHYSWLNLTNVLWVDGPVGSGFTAGEPRATDDEEAAQEFLGFFKNFQETFGIHNYKIYLSGAGMEAKGVPYVAAAMQESNQTAHYDLKGVMLADAVMDTRFSNANVFTIPFGKYHQHLIPLNSSYQQQLDELDQKCGFADFREKFFRFPAAGVQPIPKEETTTPNTECDIGFHWAYGAWDLNPCYLEGDITSTCPLKSDTFYDPPSGIPYLERADVKQALHVPSGESQKWCFEEPFDWFKSASPFEDVLPKVIDYTKRVSVAYGDLNSVVSANGALLRIQNMTWGGELGFKEKPTKPIVIKLPWLQEPFQQPDLSGEQGTAGEQGFERGLLWVRSYLSKGRLANAQPRMSYRQLQWTLGRIDEL